MDVLWLVKEAESDAISEMSKMTLVQVNVDERK